MSELASVTTAEPEVERVERVDTVTIRACANGWLIPAPGGKVADTIAFTSMLDLRIWLSNHLIDNT